MTTATDDDTLPDPTVLLLHGWAGSAHSTWQATGWVRQIQALGREVVAPDLPGHGAGGGSRDPRGYADLPRLVHEGLPDRPAFDVVGFSLGAKLALALALGEPGRFRRIVLAGLGANLFAPENAAPVVDALHQGVDDVTAPAARDLAVYAAQADHDIEAIAAVLSRPTTPLQPEQLAVLDHQILLAVGEEDGWARGTEELAQHLPTARFLRLPNIDHLSTPHSARLRAAALEFLQRTDRPDKVAV